MQFVLLIKIATASLKQISYSMVENMCLFLWLFNYLFVPKLFMYLFNYLFIRLSTYLLSVCLLRWLFIYLLIYLLFRFPSSAISVPVRFMSVPVRLPFQYDACVFQYDLTFQYITCSFQYSNDSSTRQVHSSTVSVLVRYKYTLVQLAFQ
jgi:hypothetical protein